MRGPSRLPSAVPALRPLPRWATMPCFAAARTLAASHVDGDSPLPSDILADSSLEPPLASRCRPHAVSAVVHSWPGLGSALGPLIGRRYEEKMLQHGLDRFRSMVSPTTLATSIRASKEVCGRQYSYNARQEEYKARGHRNTFPSQANAHALQTIENSRKNSGLPERCTGTTDRRAAGKRSGAARSARGM